MGQREEEKQEGYMASSVAEVCAATVVSSRFAFSQQTAIVAYRQFLRDKVFPNPVYGDKKAHRTARTNLLNFASIELLTFPWRLSAFVAPEAIAAAGLRTREGDEVDFVTRRGLGKMLCAQFGDKDSEAYEKRVGRYAEGWLMFGLVTEVEGETRKELRGSALLHELMSVYYVTLSRGSSQKLVIALQQEQIDG
jgi:hypothetical protein